MSAILKALQNRKVEVELKSEVVEMASTRDLAKAIGNGESKMKAIRNDSSSFLDAKRKLEGTLGNSEYALTELKKMQGDFSKAAKDLGVNADSVKEYKEATKKIEDLEGAIKTFQNLIK